MKTRLTLVALLMSVFCVAGSADLIAPTLTEVYFQNDGRPYTKPVEYTVNCYGYNMGMPPKEKEPGTYTPELVFTYSASCPAYGCKIYNGYYLNYRHIDYCNIEGNAGGTEFKIVNWSDSPVPDVAVNCEDFSQCDVQEGRLCYKEKRGYSECMEQSGYDTSACGDYLEVVPDSEIQRDDKGSMLMRKCKVTIELPGNVLPSDVPMPPPPPQLPEFALPPTPQAPAQKTAAGDSTPVLVAVVLAAALVGLVLFKMRAERTKSKKRKAGR